MLAQAAALLQTNALQSNRPVHFSPASSVYSQDLTRLPPLNVRMPKQSRQTTMSVELPIASQAEYEKEVHRNIKRKAKYVTLTQSVGRDPQGDNYLEVVKATNVLAEKEKRVKVKSQICCNSHPPKNLLVVPPPGARRPSTSLRGASPDSHHLTRTNRSQRCIVLGLTRWAWPYPAASSLDTASPTAYLVRDVAAAPQALRSSCAAYPWAQCPKSASPPFH